MPLSRVLFTLLLLVASSTWANAELPSPQGPVILEVSGNIAQTNHGDEAHFDYAMLAALGMHEIATHTPWTEGLIRFEGPLGRDLLEAVGAQGDQLSVKGLDGYVAEVPASDFFKHEVILALKMDGERLRVRDRGPIIIVYPFDQKPQLLTEQIRFRSVWQVASIHVGESPDRAGKRGGSE
ncbi:molybdopterin-dependent oxidoreductase [Halomonas sp. McH1-25]|uniref:molybdopterin-dependent oxidoreductase n=1 Tax=unclassified Halomonas TaxID=2609666 RepID=UPI001EF53549|nr:MULTISPECIES: molybdopterin-dependent oxidoreductase [unclassified Halomonas]MCG7600261.1 molybdopterin-dependent oxidoreductase [Halomonas sp. McH1-25]MCP1343423.1 molybdopterin-dependent oxidoreductase [Halomonas sp. FL8]MCP1359626.1 molybdopterin-dependent oxidoreductase [Halomonas sp. BBD45]